MYKRPTSLKYTLNAQTNRPIPRVKSANKSIAKKMNRVSNPIDASKTTISIPKGIKEKSKLMMDVTTSEIGKAMVSTLMDFRTPLLFITELIAVVVALL